MEVSVLELRYKMNKVLEVLEKSGVVTIIYHGKIKGVIVPAKERFKIKASKHPFFGMTSVENKPVEEIMEKLRGVNQNNMLL